MGAMVSTRSKTRVVPASEDEFPVGSSDNQIKTEDVGVKRRNSSSEIKVIKPTKLPRISELEGIRGLKVESDLDMETDSGVTSTLETNPTTPQTAPSTALGSVSPSTSTPGSPPEVSRAVSIISQSISALSPTSNVASDDSDSVDMPKKRKYKIDRENIKINKRIMSKDTEDVIRMFKKFDDEVLTNADAKARLLSLGFETRKRYITTFKHYIRFCCNKGLDSFFVTGDLMKEFYQEQFDKSSSDKPVIRLRKMDPAFSKLQEINFLVYGLENKDIPNRQVALDYLVYKETGKKSKGRAVEGPKSRSPSIPSTKIQIHEIISPPDEQDAQAPEAEKKVRKKTVKKDELVSFLQTSFCNHKEDLNNSVKQSMKMIQAITSEPQVMDILSSLMGEVNGSCERFYYDLVHGPGAHHGEKDDAPPIIDINHDIYTIYEIVEEWYAKEPSIVTRVQRWGLEWIRDDVDKETYEERESVIKFVDRLCQACNEPDRFVMATDCDRYIRDQSILDEFITEIELDVEALFKRFMRFRKKLRG